MSEFRKRPPAKGNRPRPRPSVKDSKRSRTANRPASTRIGAKSSAAFRQGAPLESAAPMDNAKRESIASQHDAKREFATLPSHGRKAATYASQPVIRRSVADGQGVSQPLVRTVALAFIALLAVALLVFALFRFFGGEPTQPETSNQFGGDDQLEATPAAIENPRVTLVAVGDNAPNENIAAYADSLAGNLDDGKYDYLPIIEPIAERIQSADLAFVNEETCVGGDEIGPQGYPSFNATDDVADFVTEAGFNLVSLANNHCYDWGPYGALEHSVEVWEKQPVTYTGNSVTEEQYNRIATRECNGMTFALLAYTYGVNAYEEDDLPMHSVNFIDTDRIASDVARARESADVVLVAMHWGIENETEPSDEQRKLAQFLADLDVDVVIGAHPHVTQPMEWLENAAGAGHRTLVAYSLGNFIFDHEAPYPENAIEGMLTCDFVRAGSGSVSVENVSWTPLVCHVSEERDSFAVYALDDYTAELAVQNRAFADIDDPLDWIRTHTQQSL